MGNMTEEEFDIYLFREYSDQFFQVWKRNDGI